MPTPIEAYRQGYERGRSDSAGDRLAEITMGMLRDDPGGHFQKGYSDGAAGKLFDPPSIPAPKRLQANGLVPKFSENPIGWFLGVLFVVELWVLWQLVKAPFQLVGSLMRSEKPSPWVIIKNVIVAGLAIALIWWVPHVNELRGPASYKKQPTVVQPIGTRLPITEASILGKWYPTEPNAAFKVGVQGYELLPNGRAYIVTYLQFAADGSVAQHPHVANVDSVKWSIEQDRIRIEWPFAVKECFHVITGVTVGELVLTYHCDHPGFVDTPRLFKRDRGIYPDFVAPAQPVSNAEPTASPPPPSNPPGSAILGKWYNLGPNGGRAFELLSDGRLRVAHYQKWTSSSGVTRETPAPFIAAVTQGRWSLNQKEVGIVDGDSREYYVVVSVSDDALSVRPRFAPVDTAPDVWKRGVGPYPRFD